MIGNLLSFRSGDWRAVVLGCAVAGFLTGTGQAQAVTLTKVKSGLYQSLYGLTADSKYLYVTGATGALRDFANPGNGVIGKLPLAGGTLKTLYDGTNYATSSGHVAPMLIATDGKGTFYWSDPDAGPSTGAAFLSAPGAGGSSTQFFGICCGPGVLPGDSSGVALSGSHLYFSDMTGGRVGVDPSGSSATQIGPTRYDPEFSTEEFAPIAILHDKIFIADSAESRAADSSGTAILYDVSAAIAPGITWISTDGSSGFHVLNATIGNPHGITVGGAYLYVTTATSIWKVNPTSGNAVRLPLSTGHFQDLQGIVYVNGALYVADSRTVYGPYSGGIATATSDGPGIIWKVTL